MKQVDIDRQIEMQWRKSCKNASEAHWRAQEINRLEKLNKKSCNEKEK